MLHNVALCNMNIRKENWYCPGCGTPFTRASSCRRHIGSLHPGCGFPVREVEYFLGRQSGVFAAPSYLSTNHDRPTFKPKQDQRSILEIAVDESIIEFWREAGRINARNVFLPTNRFAATGGYYQESVSAFDPNKQLFGMTAYVCPNCFMIKPKMHYFAEGEKGRSSEQMIHCTVEIPDHIQKMKEKKEDYVSRMSKGFPQFLKACVDAATGGKNGIVAVEILDPARINNTIIFVLTGSGGRKFSVTLQYSDDKSIKLDPSSTGEWALRAIENKHTAVNDQELIEFLQKTKESTFGFFKKEEKDGVHIYLMAVAKHDEGDNIDLVAKEIEPIQIPDSTAKKEPDITQSTHATSAQEQGIVTGK